MTPANPLPDAERYRQLARIARRDAARASGDAARKVLDDLADEYERRALDLEKPAG
jgi:hypothetical protein